MITSKNPLSSTFWLGNPHLLYNNSSLLLTSNSTRLPPCRITCKFEVDTEKIKRRLIKKGYMPTPKIIYRLKKKEIQKAKRKEKKKPEKEIPQRVKEVMEEEALFETAAREYEMLMAELRDTKINAAEVSSVGTRKFTLQENAQTAFSTLQEYAQTSSRRENAQIESDTLQKNVQTVLEVKGDEDNDDRITLEENRQRTADDDEENLEVNKAVKMEGKPWEREKVLQKNIKGLNSGVSNTGSGRGGKRHVKIRGSDGRLKGKGEDLEQFREMLAKRGKGDLTDLNWLLDDDVDDADFAAGNGSVKGNKEQARKRPRHPIDEGKQIKWLTERLISVNATMPTWQLSNLMHAARMKLTDGRLVKIVQVLGDMGNWMQAVEVVHWVHNRKRYKYCKGSGYCRYVYTTLLAVLGKARRPVEALNVFHAMREHISSYPDMPAYRCIATTLGKAGYLKELLDIIHTLRTGPAKLMKNVKFLHWDPRLEPDVVVYNAVLNACVPWLQWKGAFWVLQQMRQNGMRPSCATYGLAIEVMLAAGKYELVHMLFEKMGKAGLTPNASTYKAIIRTFWKEGKTDEAVRAVDEMECRGIAPTASSYYELACGLCSAGRWQDALLQVEKLRKCPPCKPLAVTFTGLIQCCAEAGHIHDCESIFNYMQEFCAPNIGTVNAMIHTYAQNNMFKNAKLLFEEMKKGRIGLKHPASIDSRLSPDIFTYNAMLEACAMADEWGYMDNVYKQMVLHGHSIDQNQHAWLIVAASKAGKPHVLDHAFDQILEQGKIAHISLYKEKICKSLQLEEYAKVIDYINSMAKGSMDMSQNEWTELFKKNTNRISKDNLKHLSNELNSCVANDFRSPIFRNLIKSLHVLCGLDASSEYLKFNRKPYTMKYDGKPHSYANNMSLYAAVENGKVTDNIQNPNSLDNGGMHEKNPKLGTEKDFLNPLLTEEIDNDVNNLGNPSLPSSDEILSEWKQDVVKKSLVQC